MNAIKKLQTIQIDDQQLVGGKAASLGNLRATGITIPDGFVVTTQVQVDDLKSPKIQQEILQAFDALQAPYVAVRSSAIGEDSQTTSWAGQLETFLNVDKDSLLTCIKKCFQSATSDRARSYAIQHHVAAGRVAVLVQTMVQSEVSGVAFSVHPITQNTRQIVVEAGLGLGEAVVSGEITPDTYIVNKDTGICAEKHIAQQGTMLVKRHKENVWVPTGERGNSQKIDDANLKKLVSAVLQIEKLQGVPVDVEWAIANDSLQILQARPITTIQ